MKLNLMLCTAQTEDRHTDTSFFPMIRFNFICISFNVKPNVCRTKINRYIESEVCVNIEGKENELKALKQKE